MITIKSIQEIEDQSSTHEMESIPSECKRGGIWYWVDGEFLYSHL